MSIAEQPQTSKFCDDLGVSLPDLSSFLFLCFGESFFFYHRGRKMPLCELLEFT